MKDEGRGLHINGDDPYDTSAFNIDYSDEDETSQYHAKSYPSKTFPPAKSNRPKPSNNTVPKSYVSKPVPTVPAKHIYNNTHDTDGVTTDDDVENDFEYNTNARPGPAVVSKFPGSQNMSVDEYGFVIKPNQPNQKSRTQR